MSVFLTNFRRSSQAIVLEQKKIISYTILDIPIFDLIFK